MVRGAVAAGVLMVLFVLTWAAGRAGFASLLSIYAAKANQIAAADAAVSLSPSDPDAHYARAAILEDNGDLPAAIEEYEQAVRLRADDYVLWLALARARELNGDTAGAIAAARQAVPMAPYYAQPHWQLGNILLRAGQHDEGFKELRLSGEADPTLLPAVIDLVWQLSGGDIQFTKQAVRPQSSDSFTALAEYFRKRGKVNEAIDMFRAAGAGAEEKRQQYIGELISAKDFKLAWVLWSTDHPESHQNTVAGLVDPGFEHESKLDEVGFGWRRDTKAQSVSLSLDANNPKEGRSSLRVDFNGDSDPVAPIISQLVLIEPRTRYKLHFAARAEGIVTGGRPLVIVADANNNNLISQTSPFQQLSEWQDYEIDFNSGETTNAIQLILRREPCSKSPCPIFGHLWLDNFSLRKL